jgi:hypothetical protein
MGHFIVVPLDALYRRANLLVLAKRTIIESTFGMGKIGCVSSHRSVLINNIRALPGGED